MRKSKNYINEKGEYVNIENKTLREIWLEGYKAGREHKELMDIGDSLREVDDGK